MTVKFRCNRWEIDVTWPDGVRHRRRMPDRATADRINNRIIAVIDDVDTVWKDLRARLGWKTEVDPGTFKDFGELYLQKYAALYNRRPDVKQSRVGILCRQLGKIPLAALTMRHAAGFITWRRGRKISNATINRDLAVLKHMTRWAADQGFLRADPFARLRPLPEPKWEGRRPEASDIARVFAELPPALVPLFTFILETGCRRNEALTLQHWQLDVANQAVTFPARATKGAKSRTVPLTVRALEAVESMPRACDYVFFDPLTLDRWYSVRSQWETARSKAMFPWLTIKDLRRAYGIRLSEAGAPLHYIQEMLGHSSVVMTEQHYARFSPDHARAAVLELLEKTK